MVAHVRVDARLEDVTDMRHRIAKARHAALAIDWLRELRSPGEEELVAETEPERERAGPFDRLALQCRRIPIWIGDHYATVAGHQILRGPDPVDSFEQLDLRIPVDDPLGAAECHRHEGEVSEVRDSSEVLPGQPGLSEGGVDVILDKENGIELAGLDQCLGARLRVGAIDHVVDDSGPPGEMAPVLGGHTRKEAGRQDVPVGALERVDD